MTGWPPVFHLAENDHVATSHNKVDLAAGSLVPSGQKPVTRADKPGKRGKFGISAGTLGLPRNRVYRAALALNGDETGTS